VEPETLLVVLSVSVLGGMVAVALAQMRARALAEEVLRGLTRLEARLDEQSRQAEASERRIEEFSRGTENSIRDDFAKARHGLDRDLHALGEQLKLALGEHQIRFEQRQGDALRVLQQTLAQGLQGVRQNVLDALARSSVDLGRRVEALTQSTDQRLRAISGEVEKRLVDGFERTTATFADVLKRLALIDEAQKRITELSSNVLGLQEVLADKRSRGAFGEVQLNALVRNMLPESSFRLQHTLSNDRIADCVLFLPPPTGTVAIDAKFPKEAYDRMTDTTLGEPARLEAERAFKQDIRRHIGDIAGRYIIPGETSDGALMFIPAEAIFAEIHAHHPDLVELAYQKRVWMVSPTTMMAILNTARAVLKDEATRRQVHVIQEHLALLAKDFERFELRMQNLAKHVRQANKDIEDVHVSANKITRQFQRIEQVEMDEDPRPALDHREAPDMVEPSPG
jgi:DNA recombination protein RmuC